MGTSMVKIPRSNEKPLGIKFKHNKSKNYFPEDIIKNITVRPSL